MIASFENIKISFVFPCRDASSWTEYCTKKLQKLRSSVWEAIFVDDHSDEKNFELLKFQLSQYQTLPVRLEQSPGQGPGPARNTGLRLAKGEYIAFLDVDDEWQLERLIALAENSTSDVVMYNHQRRYADGSIKMNQASGILEAVNGHEINIENIHDRQRLFYNFNVCWNKLCRREFLIGNNLFFHEGIYEDIDWSFLCLSLASTVSVTSDVLYTYVQHDGSVLKQNGIQHLAIIEAYHRAMENSVRMNGRFQEVIKDKSIKHFFAVLQSNARLAPENKKVFLKKISIFVRTWFSASEFFRLPTVPLWKKMVAYFDIYWLWSLTRKAKTLKSALR
ncbi:glycosyltransferase family 2 protein [Kushneria marisflavi]|uniref:Glycosyltransferase 2-like domain-containing protein n=1 Tax=Kushneria marisflavi TaxID=157779 RepID=A0A240US85_9GAMM|nr:glycosyltransferase [Kushneria marisflavi]ART63943.1 hypothetical protein B9H00_13500 [Kushneria marisflavi]RKD85665.1 glycosyltransferase involved in cell wall biosynthesis [Kushneria marisflavi]